MMSTDGPTPDPCDFEIFLKGEGVCIVDGPSNAVERWVKELAKQADARVDWHYSGGRANVLHLGDKASRERVLAVAGTLKHDRVRLIDIGGPALYRRGVE